MPVAIQSRTIIGVGYATAVVIVTGWAMFVAPQPGDEMQAPPPRILPGADALPGIAAPDTPHARRETRACAGAAEAMAIGPRPITPPQSWFADSDYPTTALMAGHAGITQTELVIDDGGTVIGCGVAGSSGHFSLDGKTCAVFRSRAHFHPAEDMRGCPMASVWHQRVRWVIGG